MTTNLLHNAIVHNLPNTAPCTSRPSSAPSPSCSLSRTPGERLTPQLVSTLTEPFQRGTERIRGDHAGVGLGLAIVKSITQAHDGTLTLTPGPPGALRHGAATRRATRRQMTISGIAARPEGNSQGLRISASAKFIVGSMCPAEWPSVTTARGAVTPSPSWSCDGKVKIGAWIRFVFQCVMPPLAIV